jgi:histidine triad (HIT) family protein
VLDAACIFCKIIQGSITSSIVKANDFVIAIKDISPKAPIHYLIIPKIHIENINYLTDTHADICWRMMEMARELGKDVPAQSFNLISNNGVASGQSVLHLHWHFLAGRNIYDHGLQL